MSRGFRLIKTLIRPLLTCWRKLVIDGFFGGFWAYRYYLTKHPSKFGLVLYNSYMADYGAWIGIEAEIGSPAPRCPHDIFGLFISKAAVIGKNCVIFQHVTIGSVTTKGSKRIGAPKIGDNVLIGAGAIIIGNVSIGDNARIGANSIVTQSIPANSTVYMSGMTVVKKEMPMENSFSIACLDE